MVTEGSTAQKREQMLQGVFRHANPATMTVQEWGDIEVQQMQEQAQEQVWHDLGPSALFGLSVSFCISWMRQMQEDAQEQNVSCDLDAYMNVSVCPFVFLMI